MDVISHDLIHEHPLRRIPNLLTAVTDYPWYTWCYGCNRYFLDGEAAYGCSIKCGVLFVLHEECVEMPREIRHPLHHPSSHTLTLKYTSHTINDRCAVCEESVNGLFYKCTSGGGCSFFIHMGCAGRLVAVEDEKHPPLNHPSHPQHQLGFSKKTSQGWCSFPCDACGSTEKGNSYICTICDYWMHEACALLPPTARFPSHHHSLSLSFCPPWEYIKYEFDCAICNGPLRLRHWVYHCQLCRYVVHLNCAPSTIKESNNEDAVDDEDGIAKCPIDDINEEIIRAFVERESGEIVIPYDNTNTKKYKFNNHNHLLSFITFSDSSSSHDHNQEKDDDDDDDIPRILELRCDGCALPIVEKNEYEKGYMSCDECKYFLHLSCFNLPQQIKSLPLHPLKDHSLELRKASKLANWARCYICYFYTNGLFYKCTKCRFRVDIKCASLPNTIKHAAHPRHNYLKLITDNNSFTFCSLCSVCVIDGLYGCNGCIFRVCHRCVLLPRKNKHKLEKHPMELTYDAYVYHPGDFYCSSCEGQMNPKQRMYYCRDCDQSFHPGCFPATSGEYRNINFGRQQYQFVSTVHHNPQHPPLRFQIITKKKRCNICHRDTYDKPGFQCVSCNFVMCLHCSIDRRNDIKAI